MCCEAAGCPKRRPWRKIHIGIDEEALEIRAVEVTSCSIGGASMLPELLDQIPPNEEIGSVTGDEAYDTRKCQDANTARNVHAVIPPRKNVKLWKPAPCRAVGHIGQMKHSEYFSVTGMLLKLSISPDVELAEFMP